VLDLPLADDNKRDEISSKVTNMVAWRWMLLPMFIVDVIAFGFTALAWRRLRNGTTARADSTTVEK
jgi:hypothetical protein